ncbi:PREDICTED: sulfotransferase 6B1-like [Thamnophis sirtalis]|uniref:Sulfotransferase n=1 Tax=Thamnophis sirtalis TaxID=35019 RepID=A0A6I9YH13_9SAUR|nr:PREDICTED: sulfotransferase 6B1-like [Thamnophis sirtalis]
MTQKQLSKFLDEKLEENEKATPSERTFMYDGVKYPTMICCLETLKRVNTFRARKDDIILVSYPKTGSNWVGEILRQLEIASGKYDEVEQKQRQQILEELSLLPFLEFGDPEKFERMEKLPPRRIIKTHLIPHMLPRSFFEKKTKMLVLFRNPKDVAVSFFHFAKGIHMNDQNTWDEFFEEYITGKVTYGSYFDHISEWNKHLNDSNVFFITYEEIKENPVSALKKIAKFFDFSVTEEEIESIVEKTSFESMKNTAENYGKLGKALFRKGIVGDWTSVFSESQNEKMDRKFEETVAKTQLGMKLKYELYCKN